MILKRGKILLIMGALLTLPPWAVRAQDKVEASVGVDLVSGYVWRGQDLGNASIQPTVSIAYKGFSLAAWGSAGFDKEDTKEFDLTLGYTTGGFSVSVTDYWFNGGAGYFHYGAKNTSHVFEAHAGYDSGFLAVDWYTNFAGNDGVDSSGRRAYSSYISLAVPFRLGGLDWRMEMGTTPWGTTFYNGGVGGFEVTDVVVGISRNIAVTSRFSIPLFAKAVWNPATQGAYFIIGLSL